MRARPSCPQCAGSVGDASSISARSARNARSARPRFQPTRLRRRRSSRFRVRWLSRKRSTASPSTSSTHRTSTKKISPSTKRAACTTRAFPSAGHLRPKMFPPPSNSSRPNPLTTSPARFSTSAAAGCCESNTVRSVRKDHLMTPIRRYLIRALLLLAISTFAVAQDKPQPQPFQISADKLAAFVGQYQYDDDPDVIRSLSLDGSHLFAESRRTTRVEFVPQSEDTFSPLSNPVPVTF